MQTKTAIRARSTHQVLRGISLCLWVLPVGVYLVVAVLLWSGSGYEVTGDEPHYLRITESLVADGDFLVANNLRIRLEGALLSDELTGHVLDNGNSVHSVGLALILVPAYWAAGALGAKIWLVLLAGLWPVVLYRAMRTVGLSRAWARCLALVLSLGLPFVTASNQLYPDLLAGMIIVYVISNLFRAVQPTAVSNRGDEWQWNGFLIAWLPWLHIRFAAAAIALAIATGVVAARHRSAIPGRRWLLRLATASLVVSWALLVYYGYSCSGSILGPKGFVESLSNRFEKLAAIFLGLHLDQRQGLFLQQPLMLLGLVGLSRFVSTNWRLAFLTVVVYMSILVPNAMHPNAFGGYSFVGRYWWAAAALWVLPLSCAANLLLIRYGRAGRIVLGLICMLSLAWQAALASTYLLDPALMYNRARTVGFPVWLQPGFFSVLFGAGVWLRLPYFYEFSAYHRHVSNYFAVLACLILAAQGWVWQRQLARSPSSWPRVAAAAGDHSGAGRTPYGEKSVGALPRLDSPFVQGLGGIILGLGFVMTCLVYPELNSLSLTANRLPGRVGAVEGTMRVASPGSAPGVLMFGPYVSLPPGDYAAALEYEWQPALTSPAHWNIALDTTAPPRLEVVASGNLPPSNERVRLYRRSFSVSEERSSAGGRVQFRVHYPGHGHLVVKRLEFTPVAVHLAGYAWTREDQTRLTDRLECAAQREGYHADVR